MMKLLATTLLLCFGLGTAKAQSMYHIAKPWDFEEARQFDFWIGEWAVNNRFIQEDGSWIDAGSARVKIFPILDGKAILEFWDGRFSNGFVLRGFSLRYYDTNTSKWQLALNWPGPNRPGFSELQGAFRHGRGEFFSTAIDTAGVESITRYTFSDVSPTSLRWDNGVSKDGGRTWSAQWIMEFSRTAADPTWTPPGTPFHTYETGERCTPEEATQFDFLEGTWTGTVTHHTDETTEPARLQVHRVLDGCAVFNLLTMGEGEDARDLFQIRSYIPDWGVWVELQLDDQPGSGYHYQSGAFKGNAIELTGFVPSWYKGTPPETLQKTMWQRGSAGEVRLEMATSDDDGATWTPMVTIQLEKAHDE